MGWGFCGTNPTTGEEMGYCVVGVCHAEGCHAEIDHGLAFVCGGMHEGGEFGCGYYFCPKHLTHACTPNGTFERLCKECVDALNADGPSEDGG